jgi:hypothetical protein
LRDEKHVRNDADAMGVLTKPLRRWRAILLMGLAKKFWGAGPYSANMSQDRRMGQLADVRRGGTKISWRDDVSRYATRKCGAKNTTRYVCDASREANDTIT